MSYRLLSNLAPGPVGVNDGSLLVVPVVGVVLGLQVLELREKVNRKIGGSFNERGNKAHSTEALPFPTVFAPLLMKEWNIESG